MEVNVIETNEQRTVRVYTLGRFEIQVAGKTLADDINRSRRIWNLLAYIITHRGRNITQSEFIETMWPDDDSGNPANSLKTLLYRARATLSDAFGEEAHFLLSQRGSYSWNNEYVCIVDSEEFERLCKQAESPAIGDEERTAIYQKATSLYQGDFLPKLSDQMWVIPLMAHYQSLYLNAVKKYAALLIDAGKYKELTDLCSKALTIDSMDEQLHTYLILSYTGQGNDAAALSHYEVATDMMYRYLGVQPSDALRSAYLQIMQNRQRMETDLSIIQDNLRELSRQTGAFVCDYGFFREAYRLEARRAEREGSSVHIALITVTSPDDTVPELNRLNDTMEQLLEAIVFNLRRGDVVSRYSGAQYVVMLPSANYEDSEMVVGRILSRFLKNHPRNNLKIGYKLRQMDI